MDMDRPISWEGTAPEACRDGPVRQFLIRRRRGRIRTHSKASTAELHRSSESTMQLVQGLPICRLLRGIGGGRRGRGRLDPKAFEPNVKEYDQMLNKMHGSARAAS